MIHFFGMRKMKVWIVSSRNFETVVAASDAVEAVDVFYIYHPAERGDVWEMDEAEYNQQKYTGGEQRGTWIGGKFHTYIFIQESPDELWVRSEPKVLYTHQDVKAPMGIARQGGKGVMIYMSKLEIKMLDHVIEEVMPTDTRSQMGARMITMLHQFLNGTINRLPINWMDAKRKLTSMNVPPRITKWDPLEQIETISKHPLPLMEAYEIDAKRHKFPEFTQSDVDNEAFNDPKDRRVLPKGRSPVKKVLDSLCPVGPQTIPCKKCGGVAGITLLPEESEMSHKIECCDGGIQTAGMTEAGAIEMWNRMNQVESKVIDPLGIVRICGDDESNEGLEGKLNKCKICKRPGQITQLNSGEILCFCVCQPFAEMNCTADSVEAATKMWNRLNEIQLEGGCGFARPTTD